jgi:hypothetical protein
MEWDEAMGVLEEWSGREVVVIPYLQPGISLTPVEARLGVERQSPGALRLAIPGLAIVLRRATFIEADWVPGQEQRGISIVQGGARVDVFVDEDGQHR